MIMIPYSNFFVENYRSYYEDIADRNLKSLRLISVLGMIIGIPLIAISLIIDEFLKATGAYFILFLVSTLLHILTKSFLKRHKSAIPIVFYFFFSITMGTAIYLGSAAQPEMNAVTFIVFLVVLPLFMIDIPSRMCLFMGIFCVAFCIATKFFKVSFVATYDVINTIIFFLLSIITSHQSNYLNMKQIMSNNILEIQRDTDKMTGLWNRGFCERKITSFLQSPDSLGALLVIDIDNFKLVNDSNGHDCGDRVLKQVSSALTHSFRSTDIIGRIGGDEFLIFLPNCIDSEIIRQRVTRFLEDISKINTSFGEDIPHIGASIGIALFPNDGINYKDLFKHADEALYLSKQNGKNQYAFYHIL